MAVAALVVAAFAGLIHAWMPGLVAVLLLLLAA
jgi:hypothetical protein